MAVDYSGEQTGSQVSQRGTDKDNYKEATKGGSGISGGGDGSVKSPGNLQSSPTYGSSPSMSTSGGTTPDFEGNVPGDDGAVDTRIMETGIEYDWPGSNQGSLQKIGPTSKGPDLAVKGT